MAADVHGIGAWLAHAVHLLPEQGPLGVFVHQNPLQGFQHLPFHDAVSKVAPLRGARPYLDEEAFRAAVAAGRIERRDLEEALPDLEGAIPTPLPLGLTVRKVRLVLLERALHLSDPQGLRHALATGAFVPDPLRWAAVERRLRGRPSSPPPRPLPRRHRDVLVALGHEDPDVIVHGELQRLAASFLDQGQALAHLPGRERGFLVAVLQSWRDSGSLPRGAAGLASDLAEPATAERVVLDSLEALGVAAPDRAAFVEATLLALPGWAGMFGRLERCPDENHVDAPARLLDFLAIRLMIERHLLRECCRRAGVPLAFDELRGVPIPTEPADPLVPVSALYGLVDAVAAHPAAIDALTDAELEACFAVIEAFPPVARQRVFQEAYEGWYRRRVLNGLAALRRSPAASRAGTHPIGGRPDAAFVFCIDEREEAIRRAIEEQSPAFQTYGAAGFFGVAIDFQGLDDVGPAAYCPAVVVPGHEVGEAAVFSDRTLLTTRRRLRAAWQRWLRSLASGTRGLLGGAVQSLVLGPALGVRTAGQVLYPRRAVAASRVLWDTLVPAPATRLISLRIGPEPRTERGKLAGFSTTEKVERSANLLTNLGLVRDFPPIVVVLGHGSTSLNNPHESAHDCGACGGRRGGTNARLFAEMVNRPEVRAGLRERGIEVPTDTWFLGAIHDTADDSVVYYDLDQVPTHITPALDRAHLALEVARRESARERARRFDDAPLGIDPQSALQHVEERSSSLAQPRPEYGHCTNAMAVVGRRALTRGLFLDRRSFLVSYDPTLDSDHRVIERILAAVGPVGAGINLEYWFSSVDNEAWGCGTKLPHNVTGLIGVMNGHASDLRTGLPWQMVEIHEPMRLLLVVEATVEALLTVAGRQPEVRDLVVNEWVRLVSLDPETGVMHVFRDGAFHEFTPDPSDLPHVPRSVDWYGAHRSHLPPAIVEAGRG